MCMMCQDEKAYRAYMAYLDAREKAGEMADPDKAMDEILKELEKEAAAAVRGLAPGLPVAEGLRAAL